MSPAFRHFYEFNGFRFDVERGVLWRDGDIVSLTPKATEVLGLLLRESGNLVERKQIIDTVWSDAFVEEGNVNQAVSALRKTLGGGVIQTVPKRGYRFTAEVSEIRNPLQQEFLVEQRTISTTVIEEVEENVGSRNDSPPFSAIRNSIRPAVAAAVTVGLLLVVFVALFLSASSNDAAGPGDKIGSIAVLPLRSFSGQSVDNELELRITDALITKLGRFDDLVVRPTTSVSKYTDSTRDAIQIGKMLSVDTVLDGGVQEEGGRLRVTVQMISVRNGAQLWSGQFDGRVGQTLALQDQIAERLARDLGLTRSNSSDKYTGSNNESYEAYLKGRFLWNQRKRETYYKALEYFHRSIEIDPNFALGYTGISDSYHLLQQRNVISTKDAFEKAEWAARKAYELDPNLSEANTSMGSVSHIRYMRWKEAESFFLRAIELDPNQPEAYARLGMLYNSWGRFEEAHPRLTKAVELDPTSINNAIYLGANYYLSRQYDKAIEQFNRVLEFAPGTERAHFFLTRIYEILGRESEAVEHALKEREVYKPLTVEPLRQAYRTGGIRSFWRKQIELLEEESNELFALENHIASRYVLLGEHETAIDYVEKNLEKLGSMHNYGRVDPLFDKLRAFPRYISALSRTAPPA